MNKLPLALAFVTFLVLGGATLANVLDTFVVEHAAATANEESEDFDFDDSTSSEETTSEASSSESSSAEVNGLLGNNNSSSTATDHTYVTYTSGTKKINSKNVPYHLVEVNLKKISDLRTKLATNSSGSIGSNITQSFSDMVSDAESSSGSTVLAAISGDYAFWSGRSGYVVRNGVSYRSSYRTTTGEDFAIFKDGTVKTYLEEDYAFSSLEEDNGGCYQNWCFGPALIDNGEIAVTEDEEIDGRSKSNNERTAIGYAGANHFYFLTTEVSGSRNSSSASSFGLYELAEFFQDLGCSYAYNLDGGGSTSMYVNGDYPIEADRKLGDIIYVVDA